MDFDLAPYFKVSSEVQYGLDNNLPVVALESTIITHGMPYPENYKTAKSVENTIRNLNVIPATIAIINGIIHVGLSDDEILSLSKLNRNDIYKCTRRTLPYVLSNKLNGSTTVAATMYISYLMNIKIFVTGGIGGVHRGVIDTWDISADLIELSNTPITVICAGIKSILDIPKTLEYLETHGVTVTTLGQDNFPAFFMSNSGIKSPLKSNNVDDIASMIQISSNLKLKNGILVGVPNTYNNDNSLKDFEKLIENATNTALKEVSDRSIKGRDITPYILGRVHELTKGISLDANIKLIHNNAKIGAQIALKLYNPDPNIINHKNNFNSDHTNEVIVIGGMVSDIIATPNKKYVSSLLKSTSNPGHVELYYGGTGRNIAECIARLKHNSCTLLSACGDDIIGNKMLNYCESIGINTKYVRKSSKYPTSSYVAIYNKYNDLFISIADLDVLENTLTIEYFKQNDIANLLNNAKFIILDGNLTYDMLRFILNIIYHNLHAVNIWYEPISVAKCVRIINPNTGNILSGIKYFSPNRMELFALLRALKYPHDIVEDQSRSQEDDHNIINISNYVKYCRFILNKGVQYIILTLGSNGVLIVTKDNGYEHIKVKKIAAVDIKNTNGAGDNLCGATIAQLVNGKSLSDAVKIGINASRMCLASKHAVNPKLTQQALLRTMNKSKL